MTMEESDPTITTVMPALCRHPPCRRFTAMRERDPCVYIMASGFNGTLYIGVTSNLIGRVMQHRDGIFEGFTKRYGVKRLVWFDTADTMEVVIAAEKRIKKWRRAWKIALIETVNREWNDLSHYIH